MEMLNVDRAAAYLRTADDCLIYIHTNPDGDAVGSGGALALALRRLGKRARVFCADEIPERLRFLTEAAADVPFTRTQDASATPLSVDVASAGQLGVPEAPHFALSIDHHAVNRIGCERLLLKSDYPAAGEIVYELLCALGLPLDRPLATLLYAAISSDSGGFRYSSTRPQTHLCAAKLLETGIDFAKINRLLFETKSEVQTALEKAAYNRLELHCGGKLARRRAGRGADGRAGRFGKRRGLRQPDPAPACGRGGLGRAAADGGRDEGLAALERMLRRGGVHRRARRRAATSTRRAAGSRCRWRRRATSSCGFCRRSWDERRSQPFQAGGDHLPRGRFRRQTAVRRAEGRSLRHA